MKSNLNVARITTRLTLTGLVCMATGACNAWAESAPIAKPTAARLAAQAKSNAKASTPAASVTRSVAAVDEQPTAPVQSKTPVVDTQAAIGPNLELKLGKASLLRLPEPIERISVGNPMIADVTVISPREVYVLGKDLGTTNVIIWAKAGQTAIVDVKVSADPALLEAELRDMLPGETDIT